MAYETACSYRLAWRLLVLYCTTASKSLQATHATRKRRKKRKLGDFEVVHSETSEQQRTKASELKWEHDRRYIPSTRIQRYLDVGAYRAKSASEFR